MINNGQPGEFGELAGQTRRAMDDIVELNLSLPINVTNTDFIRSHLREQIERDDLSGPPIELVRFHVFIFCVRGSGRHMVDFTHHRLEPGTALWVRPEQIQQWDDVGADFDADVIVFESSSIPDLPLFDPRRLATCVAQLGSDTQRMSELIRWMASDLEANFDQATAAAAAGVVLRLFARHVQRNDGDSPAERLTTAFVESVDRHSNQRTVVWHARQIGASTRSVARATSASLGLRPKEVLDARVVLEAQRRLAWSEDEIATIARALQFSEPSNFTKFFRARTGMAPSEFREAASSLTSNSSVR